MSRQINVGNEVGHAIEVGSDIFSKQCTKVHVKSLRPNILRDNAFEIKKQNIVIFNYIEIIFWDKFWLGF
jgi:hypothetical protein